MGVLEQKIGDLVKYRSRNGWSVPPKVTSLQVRVKMHSIKRGIYLIYLYNEVRDEWYKEM